MRPFSITNTSTLTALVGVTVWANRRIRRQAVIVGSFFCARCIINQVAALSDRDRPKWLRTKAKDELPLNYRFLLVFVPVQTWTLSFPLSSQPIPGGLYDLYDEYDNDGEETLVTDICAVYGFASSDLLYANQDC